MRRRWDSRRRPRWGFGLTTGTSGEIEETPQSSCSAACCRYLLRSTDAATDGLADGKQPSGLTVFPGEEPSDEEMRDWLKINLPVLRRGYGSQQYATSRLRTWSNMKADLTICRITHV